MGGTDPGSAVAGEDQCPPNRGDKRDLQCQEREKSDFPWIMGSGDEQEKPGSFPNRAGGTLVPLLVLEKPQVSTGRTSRAHLGTGRSRK